jgi:hypothetical protein
MTVRVDGMVRASKKGDSRRLAAMEESSQSGRAGKIVL